MSECNCEYCVEMRQFFKIIAKLPIEDWTWMEQFYAKVDGERLDASVNKCIIDGSWVNADQIIAFQREKRSENHSDSTKTT